MLEVRRYVHIMVKDRCMFVSCCIISMIIFACFVLSMAFDLLSACETKRVPIVVIGNVASLSSVGLLVDRVI